MKKLLQILLGLILILILAYFCFISTSPHIQNDLISKAKMAYKENNITGITVEMQGEGLTVQRVLVLSGNVSTYKEKIDIGVLTRNIEGVVDVKNQINIVHQRVSVQISPTPMPTPTAQITPTTQITTTAKPTITPIISLKATPMPTAQPTLTPVPSAKITPEPTTPTHKIIESIVEIPTVVTVPKVIQNSVKVPVPIKTIAVPIPIKTEGVK